MSALLQPVATREGGLYVGGSRPGYLSVDPDGRQRLHKYTHAAFDPTQLDDGVAGYAVGSTWVNTSSRNAFVCTDNSNGNAVWQETTATTPPGGSVGDVQYNDGAGGFGASANLNWNGTNVLYLRNSAIQMVAGVSSVRWSWGVDAINANSGVGVYIQRGSPFLSRHDSRTSGFGFADADQPSVVVSGATAATFGDGVATATIGQIADNQGLMIRAYDDQSGQYLNQYLSANGDAYIYASKDLNLNSAWEVNLHCGETKHAAVRTGYSQATAFYAKGDDSATYVAANSGTDKVSIDGTSHLVTFTADSVDRAFVNSTGFGVGTSSPRGKLELYQSSSAYCILDPTGYGATGYVMDFTNLGLYEAKMRIHTAGNSHYNQVTFKQRLNSCALTGESNILTLENEYPPQAGDFNFLRCVDTNGSVVAKIGSNGSGWFGGSLAVGSASAELQLVDGVDIDCGTTAGTMIAQTSLQKLGFFGATPVTQRSKASYSNWASLSDVVSALVDLGLFDQV